MEQRTVVLAVIGAVAGYAAYTVYPDTGLTASLLVLFTVGWFLYRFSSPGKAWDTLGLFINPVMTPIFAFLAAFSYMAYEGVPTGEAALFGLGAAFLGAALGMFLYKYWNIGG